MATFLIDDAQWNTPYLSLSPGWNMIGKNADDDHYLSASTADRTFMRVILSQFQSGTVSWTRAKYSSNMITFNGTGIEVYGLAGPSQGVFSAVMDGKVLGAFNAYNEINQSHILLSSKGLAQGTHNLTMINLEEGKAFTFDYAKVDIGSASTQGAATPAAQISPTTVSSNATTLPPTSISPSSTPPTTLLVTSTSSSTSSSSISASSSSISPSSTSPTHGLSTPITGLSAAQTTISPSASYAPYAFSWNTSTIVVIALGGTIFLGTVILSLIFFIRRHYKRNSTIGSNDKFSLPGVPSIRIRHPSTSSSAAPLQEGEKLGRRRTLLEALKLRRIGAPRIVETAPIRDFRLDSDGSVRNVEVGKVRRNEEWEI